ncbi:hypothetical protein T484DRAFT_1976886 [Baffinella frigidus]|nr:hypothetical protein T484DRAFT_1976886 [Cryptophyta sp. CCMP2293]
MQLRKSTPTLRKSTPTLRKSTPTLRKSTPTLQKSTLQKSTLLAATARGKPEAQAPATPGHSSEIQIQVLF